ncbi:hypothetical protein [Jeongeupia chitinilytica]|uniref:Fimbrial assembly protein n=1 Tax=Jeongeupia chitinilytica TaxID=1041641 RepID=A0ABQ3H1X6_9NEIS|nr:hypothetical protein [Jeongeupia chitinilytica]GHD66153.1 hypothetical protein GCM10007350_28000 [Jeongeupia chitinilytica]
MRTIQLDFHRKPSATPWLGLALIAAGVVVLLWVLSRQDVAEERRKLVDTQEAELSWQIKKREASRLEAQKEAPLNDKVAAIEHAQSLSPETGLAALEAAWLPTIAYTKIDVSTTERNLKLELEAKTQKDLLAWIDALAQQPDVAQVMLARQSLKPTDPFKPTGAAVEVRWRAAEAP